MKKSIITLIILGATLLSAQAQGRRDAARYDTMNSEGVWSVGLSIVPIASLVHPAGDLYGGTHTALGSLGVGVEGSYFVRDGWRAAVEMFYTDNGSASTFDKMSGAAYTTQSSFTLGALAYRHFGRWYAGAGLTFGRSSLRYRVATAEELPNIPLYGDTDFTQRKGSFGVAFAGGYQLSPFLKVGGYWRPSIAGGGYAHSLGLVATIYLPFVDAVVCK
ncbi:MAG: hypothetical protein IKB18_02540 [Tidjanibacter sp.]|nr:hypothetical protein [Tidjanibacter sp.]